MTRPIGHERVLIIEDADPSARWPRSPAAIGLKCSTPSGEAFERLFDDDVFDVHLVLSDIMLKGMSGPQFAERLRARRPRCALFMSGYADDTVLAFGAVDVSRSSCTGPSRPSRSPRRSATCSIAPVRSAED